MTQHLYNVFIVYVVIPVSISEVYSDCVHQEEIIATNNCFQLINLFIYWFLCVIPTAAEATCMYKISSLDLNVYIWYCLTR